MFPCIKSVFRLVDSVFPLTDTVFPLIFPHKICNSRFDFVPPNIQRFTTTFADGTKKVKNYKGNADKRQTAFLEREKHQMINAMYHERHIQHFNLGKSSKGLTPLRLIFFLGGGLLSKEILNHIGTFGRERSAK